MRKIPFLLLILIISSCEKDCKLERIDESVFDLNKVKEKYYLISELNEIDSLILKDKTDIYKKASFKGPMNYRECEHYKSYEFKFQNETIKVSLRKNDKSDYELDVISHCFVMLKPFIIDASDLSTEEFTFNKGSCGMAESEIQKITLKGYQIESIEMADNKVWRMKN